MLMSAWVFVRAEIHIKLPESWVTIGSAYMCQGYGQQTQEGKTNMHMQHLKACIVLAAY